MYLGNGSPASPYPVFSPNVPIDYTMASSPESVVAAAMKAIEKTKESAQRARYEAELVTNPMAVFSPSSSPWMSTPGSAAVFPGEQQRGFNLPSASPKLVSSSESTTALGAWSDTPSKISASPGGGEDEKTVRSDLECVKEEEVKSFALPTPTITLEELPEDCPSIGSYNHPDKCTPCAWFWKLPDSCNHAKKCTYCHLCPEGELKKRKKQKVAVMRAGGATPKTPLKSPTAGRTISLNSLI
mmetsp:Transcript_27425/g.44000  ORF Transcript_27425/g.44000 Transcript_27425/m.44000 type:complete len:242 (-) Transcript_27425:217-942(-)